METVATPDVSQHTPDVLHYTYRLAWSEEDHEFVATCAEFPSLSWLAPTQLDALRGLEDLLRGTLVDMAEQGEDIPEPFSEREFSGKFNARVGTELHRYLAIRAAEAHMSLNMYIVIKLASGM